MIIRGATLYSRVAAVLAILFALAGCGGGGGGDSFLGDTTNEVRLRLLDADGNQTSVITSSSPATLEVRLTGEGRRGVVVSATVTLGTLFPTTGTALTNDNGIALFQIEAGDTVGAGEANITATTENGTVTGTIGYQIGVQDLRLGFFDDDGMFVEGAIRVNPSTPLSPTGTAELSVTLLNAAGDLVLTPQNVNFSSGCTNGGLATTSPANPVISVNGTATTQYLPSGCSGLDQLRATVVGTTVDATATIEVAAAEANAINFVSADPDLIVLRGTGGGDRDETSDVTFQVVDRNGTPLPAVRVVFSLTTEVGGISLSPPSAQSDQEGLVSTTVSSGDIATSVRVIATFEDGSSGPVSTVSDRIVVSTGLPDQNSISLSVSDTFVVDDAFDVDGITRVITVRMADKFNNPVVDGTAAVFTTEYGAIEASCLTGVANGPAVGGTPESGSCSVQWVSQSPRIPTLTGSTFIPTIYDDDYSCPDHDADEGPCPSFLGEVAGGRSRLTVHAIGEESFVDRNGNGILDEDERDLFENLPEAFFDQNEDGVWTPALQECIDDPLGSIQCISGQEEEFVDFNSDNEYNFNDDPPVYNGLLCPPEGDGVWCSRELLNVFDENIVILSDSEWYIRVTRGTRALEPGAVIRRNVFHNIYISDSFNNRPPGGTTVSITAEDNCELVTNDSIGVPNNASKGAFATGFTVRPSDPIDPTQGTVKISFSSPASLERSVSFLCEGGFNCDLALSPRPPECPPLDPNSP